MLIAYTIKPRTVTRHHIATGEVLSTTTIWDVYADGVSLCTQCYTEEAAQEEKQALERIQLNSLEANA